MLGTSIVMLCVSQRSTLTGLTQFRELPDPPSDIMAFTGAPDLQVAGFDTNALCSSTMSERTMILALSARLDRLEHRLDRNFAEMIALLRARPASASASPAQPEGLNRTLL